MPAQQIRRMPVSCENCRRRKIRCLGSRVPCDTCLRRGRASSCHFLKHDDESTEKKANDGEHANLVDRISQLEQLLKQQIALSTTMLAQQDASSHSASAASFSPFSDHSLGHTGQRPIGRLVTDSRGYVRFVPSEFVAGPDVELLDQLHGLSTGTAPSEAAYNPFFTDTLGPRQQLLDLLPSMSQCDALKAMFFDVFSPLFHVLHDPSFDALYHNFRRCPEDVPLSFLALVFTVIAIATTALSDDHPLLNDLGHEANNCAKVRRLSAKYQSAAMRCLAVDNFLWQHSLFTLQTLILLIYSLSHTRGPAWSLLGATFNIAVAIGCHIDPSQLEGLSRVESEERRRCWAALMMLHTIQNTCLGNIAPVIIASSVHLPEDIEDDDLMNGTSPSVDLSEQRCPSKMAYLLQKFKLYQLAAEVCQLPVPTAGAGADRIMALHDRIVDQENEQLARFSDLVSLPLYHQAHARILTIYTNHLFLILHRPCLKPSNRSTRSTIYYRNESRMLKAVEQCFYSSMTILQNYDELCSEARFGSYRWYTNGIGSFHALLAASTLIVAVSDPHITHEGSSVEALSLLQRCMQIFRDAAGRSEICARGLLFLERVLQSSTGSTHVRQDFAGSGPLTFFDRSSDAMSASDSPSTTGAAQRSRMMNCEQGQHQYGFAEPQPAPEPGIDQPKSGYATIDLDGWAPPQQLMDFVSDGANQQWLAPSSFAWDAWLPLEADAQVAGFGSGSAAMPSATSLVGMQVV